MFVQGVVLVSLVTLTIVLGFHVAVDRLRHDSTCKFRNLRMGNNAKFGIFSPAVYFAKLVLGDSKLNKVRYSLYCNF